MIRAPKNPIDCGASFNLKATVIYENAEPFCIEYRAYSACDPGWKVRYDADVGNVRVTFAPQESVEESDLPRMREEAREFFRRYEVDSWTTSPGAS